MSIGEWAMIGLFIAGLTALAISSLRAYTRRLSGTDTENNKLQ